MISMMRQLKRGNTVTLVVPNIAWCIQRSLTALTSRRRFTQSDVDTFANISRDKNPIHVDTTSANKYGKPIVHGTLILGHLSGMIASEVPGSLLTHMDIKFENYLHVGDEVEITANSQELSRSVLTMKVTGLQPVTDKTIFSGAIDVVITKDLIRRIRKDNPQLMNVS